MELTLAVHRVFNSPRDMILWDTGHQAYVHKIVTGRQAGFSSLRQGGGLSGYPCRAESVHDWVENIARLDHPVLCPRGVGCGQTQRQPRPQGRGRHR